MFSVFYKYPEHKILLSLFTSRKHSDSGMNKVMDIIKELQRKKIEKIENLPEEERGRDSIQVPIIDLIVALDDDEMVLIYNDCRISKTDLLLNLDSGIKI